MGRRKGVRKDIRKVPGERGSRRKREEDVGRPVTGRAWRGGKGSEREVWTMQVDSRGVEARGGCRETNKQTVGRGESRKT